MKNSKFIIDKLGKLFEQGIISSKDLSSELFNILKSKRDEIVFKMKLTSKDEFVEVADEAPAEEKAGKSMPNAVEETAPIGDATPAEDVAEVSEVAEDTSEAESSPKDTESK